MHSIALSPSQLCIGDSPLDRSRCCCLRGPHIIMFLSPPKLWVLERASQPCLIAPKVRSVGVLATLLCTNTSSYMLMMIMLFSSTQVHGHGSHNTSRPLHFVDM